MGSPGERVSQADTPTARNRSKSGRMNAVLPIGYVTLLEAAAMLLPDMYAGVPDLPIVTSLRQEGIDVKEGTGVGRAVVELWKAVDKNTVRSVAIGGRPRRVVRLDPRFTKAVPTLRSPRGRGFTLLRQSNPAYHQLASWFGPLLHSAALAFREREVQQLPRKLMRARRIAQGPDGRKNARERPSRMGIVRPPIRELVTKRKWTPQTG